MSTHNIVFYGELTKIIFQLSSNTHLNYLYFCGTYLFMAISRWFLCDRLPVKACSVHTFHFFHTLHPRTGCAKSGFQSLFEPDVDLTYRHRASVQVGSNYVNTPYAGDYDFYGCTVMTIFRQQISDIFSN